MHGLVIAKALDGEVLRPRLTVDGLRNLIADLRVRGQVPKAIYVSEHDRRDLNQDLMAGSIQPVAKEDQKPEHDGVALGVIEGVVILTDPSLARGKARCIFAPPVSNG